MGIRRLRQREPEFDGWHTKGTLLRYLGSNQCLRNRVTASTTSTDAGWQANITSEVVRWESVSAVITCENSQSDDFRVSWRGS